MHFDRQQSFERIVLFYKRRQKTFCQVRPISLKMHIRVTHFADIFFSPGLEAFRKIFWPARFDSYTFNVKEAKTQLSELVHWFIALMDYRTTQLKSTFQKIRLKFSWRSPPVASSFIIIHFRDYHTALYVYARNTRHRPEWQFWRHLWCSSRNITKKRAPTESKCWRKLSAIHFPLFSKRERFHRS